MGCDHNMSYKACIILFLLLSNLPSLSTEMMKKRSSHSVRSDGSISTILCSILDGQKKVFLYIYSYVQKLRFNLTTALKGVVSRTGMTQQG